MRPVAQSLFSAQPIPGGGFEEPPPQLAISDAETRAKPATIDRIETFILSNSPGERRPDHIRGGPYLSRKNQAPALPTLGVVGIPSGSVRTDRGRRSGPPGGRPARDAYAAAAYRAVSELARVRSKLRKLRRLRPSSPCGRKLTPGCTGGEWRRGQAPHAPSGGASWTTRTSSSPSPTPRCC